MAMDTRIADYLDFLGELGAANAPYFLEGGQAVNFWAEYFSNKGAGEAVEQYRPPTRKRNNACFLQATIEDRPA